MGVIVKITCASCKTEWQCRKGCSVESVPVIKFAEQQTEYTGVCEICGQQTELITDPEKTMCPICGELSLTEEEMGLWD